MFVPSEFRDAFTAEFKRVCDNTYFDLHFHGGSDGQKVHVQETHRNLWKAVTLENTQHSTLFRAAVECAQELAKKVNADDVVSVGDIIVKEVTYEEWVGETKVHRRCFVKEIGSGGMHRGMNDLTVSIWQGAKYGTWQSGEFEQVGSSRNADEVSRLAAEKRETEAEIRKENERLSKEEVSRLASEKLAAAVKSREDYYATVVGYGDF